MKNYLKIAAFMLVAVLMTACSKSEKDQLIEYNQAMVAWITSPDFMKSIKNDVKKLDDINPYMEKNMERLAKETGFQSAKQANELFKKYAKDADIKKLMAETEKKVTPVFEQLFSFQRELMMKESPLQAQPQDTRPVPADETVEVAPAK